MNLSNYKILLASQSPRRSQLLRESGFTNFTVRPTDADETLPPQYPVEKAAAFLAEMKAEAAREWLVDDREIILAADTTVVLDNEIYNKPLDFADAQRILRQLSGNVHKVITGVCLLSKTKKRVFSDVAKVYFDVLTEEDIEFYITNYKPFDKAGAYAVQDWIGHCKIKRIEGSYETIMGLPTYRVHKELVRHFGHLAMTVSIIVNDDIELTEMRETDKENLVLYLNDRTIFNNTLTIPFPYTMDSANYYLNLCRDTEEEFGTIANFAIRERKTGALIGGCGRFLKEKYKDEIGYWLGKPFRNQGIMTEVVKKLTEYIFETTELIRIEAAVFAENEISAKTLEKAGFQREGHLKNYTLKNDEMKDVIMYAKLRP